MLVAKQLLVAIDFNSVFFSPIPWKSMATIKCLVTNILQNIFFCVQQMKDTQLEGEWMMTDSALTHILTDVS